MLIIDHSHWSWLFLAFSAEKMSHGYIDIHQWKNSENITIPISWALCTKAINKRLIAGNSTTSSPWTNNIYIFHLYCLPHRLKQESLYVYGRYYFQKTWWGKCIGLCRSYPDTERKCLAIQGHSVILRSQSSLLIASSMVTNLPE